MINAISFDDYDLCKLQVERTGREILIYNKSRSIYAIARDDMAQFIIDTFDLKPMDKIYIMMSIKGGQIDLVQGSELRDPRDFPNW